MIQKLSEEDFEYVLVWKFKGETTQLPSPPPPTYQEKGPCFKDYCLHLDIFSNENPWSVISYYILIIFLFSEKKSQSI
jgi:hypothetical protein